MMGSHDQSDFSHSRTSIAALGGAPGPRVGALALTAVPEPAFFAMLGPGALGMLARRRGR
jgi:hypothetical protein